MEGHWWRMTDFIILVGGGGVTLNKDKFQFCQKEVSFVGFCITDSEIKPLEKFISVTREFLVPQNITDVKSWLGLINQVRHYNRLCNVMAPFKPLLSPKQKFTWTEELDIAHAQNKSSWMQSSKVLPSLISNVEHVYAQIGLRLASDSSCRRSIAHVNNKVQDAVEMDER